MNAKKAVYFFSCLVAPAAMSLALPEDICDYLTFSSFFLYSLLFLFNFSFTLFLIFSNLHSKCANDSKCSLKKRKYQRSRSNKLEHVSLP